MNPSNFNTKFQLSCQAQELLLVNVAKIRSIGPYASQYVSRMIETARMEKRLLDACNAFITLKLAYSNERIEAACVRALSGTKFNYTTIKNILLNNLDQLPSNDQDRLFQFKEDTLDANNHENLRGASFFQL